MPTIAGARWPKGIDWACCSAFPDISTPFSTPFSTLLTSKNHPVILCLEQMAVQPFAYPFRGTTGTQKAQRT